MRCASRFHIFQIRSSNEQRRSRTSYERNTERKSERRDPKVEQEQRRAPPSEPNLQFFCRERSFTFPQRDNRNFSS